MGRLRYDSSGRLLLFEEGVPPIPTGAGGAIAAGGTGTLPTKTTRSLLDDAAGAECCCEDDASNCVSCCDGNYLNSGDLMCCYSKSADQNQSDAIVSYSYRSRTIYFDLADDANRTPFVSIDMTRIANLAFGGEPYKFQSLNEDQRACWLVYPGIATVNYRTRYYSLIQGRIVDGCSGVCQKLYTGQITPFYTSPPYYHGSRRWNLFSGPLVTGLPGSQQELRFTQAECPDLYNSTPQCFGAFNSPNGFMNAFYGDDNQVLEQEYLTLDTGDCFGWEVDILVDDRNPNGSGWILELKASVGVIPTGVACIEDDLGRQCKQCP